MMEIHINGRLNSVVPDEVAERIQLEAEDEGARIHRTANAIFIESREVDKG